MKVMMNPIYFNFADGLSLTIFSENKDSDAGHTCTFQLYYSGVDNQEKRSGNPGNYSGLISFDRANQEFYYTPGNRAISGDQLLQVIACIKTKIY
jgi:hypothetical protein